MSYKLNKYGLRQKDMDYMLNLFKKTPEIEKVILFGSRATGEFELASDVDIAIYGKKLKQQTVNHIHYLLEEESPTPLWFDAVNYNTINNLLLKTEIDKNGVLIYS